MGLDKRKQKGRDRDEGAALFRRKRSCEKSGVGRALEHQALALESAGIAYTRDAEEDWDVVHINTVFPDSLWMSLRARMKGKKVIYYGHSTMEDFRNSFPGSNLTAGLFKRWIRCCYGSGDVVITPTPYSKRLLEEYSVANVRALSNGIDLKAFERDPQGAERFRRAYGYGKESRVVMGVGHYIERKGILDFIRMAERFPQYEFIWFGYTPAALVTGRVKRAMERGRRLANLHFAGYVDAEALKDAYSGSDLFFFPTQEETEGIVMLEAMAARIPVLVRDIPVYEGWLEHGKHVYKGETAEFEKFLPGILEGTLPDLTEEAYRRVQEYGIGRIGTALSEIYGELESAGSVSEAAKGAAGHIRHA